MTFGALFGSELYLQFPTIRDTEANPTLKKATDTQYPTVRGYSATRKEAIEEFKRAWRGD